MPVLYRRIQTCWSLTHSKKNSRRSTSRSRLVRVPSRKILVEPLYYCRLELNNSAERTTTWICSTGICLQKVPSILQSTHDRTILSRGPMNLLHGYKPWKLLPACCWGQRLIMPLSFLQQSIEVLLENSRNVPYTHLLDRARFHVVSNPDARCRTKLRCHSARLREQHTAGRKQILDEGGELASSVRRDWLKMAEKLLVGSERRLDH
jgi:hypothetical protein